MLAIRPAGPSLAPAAPGLVTCRRAVALVLGCRQSCPAVRHQVGAMHRFASSSAAFHPKAPPEFWLSAHAEYLPVWPGPRGNICTPPGQAVRHTGRSPTSHSSGCPARGHAAAAPGLPPRGTRGRPRPPGGVRQARACLLSGEPCTCCLPPREELTAPPPLRPHTNPAEAGRGRCRPQPGKARRTMLAACGGCAAQRCTVRSGSGTTSAPLRRRSR